MIEPPRWQVVSKTLSDYIKKALVLKDKPEKIIYVNGLFDYLSTAEVKPILKNYPGCANLRNMVLAKIAEYSADTYLRAHRQQYHRLFAVFREMYNYLLEDDSVPVRRSDRQKERAVVKFNEYIAQAAAIAQPVKPNAPPLRIKVKVLPRRSARLMNKL